MNSPTEQAAREAAIPKADAKVKKTIGELHEQLNELEGRLKPVLRVEPATPGSEPTAETKTPTTVYEKLHDHSDQVQKACNRVQELLRLLEL